MSGGETAKQLRALCFPFRSIVSLQPSSVGAQESLLDLPLLFDPVSCQAITREPAGDSGAWSACRAIAGGGGRAERRCLQLSGWRAIKPPLFIHCAVLHTTSSRHQLVLLSEVSECAAALALFVCAHPTPASAHRSWQHAARPGGPPEACLNWAARPGAPSLSSGHRLAASVWCRAGVQRPAAGVSAAESSG